MNYFIMKKIKKLIYLDKTYFRFTYKININLKS